jgi:hypothetical protein
MSVTEEKDMKLSSVGKSVVRGEKKLKTLETVVLAEDEDTMEFHPPPTKRRMIEEIHIDGDSMKFLPPPAKRRKEDVSIEKSSVDDVIVIKTIEYIDLYPIFQ